MEYFYYILLGLVLLALFIVQHVIRTNAIAAELKPEIDAQDADANCFRCLVRNDPVMMNQFAIPAGNLGAFESHLREAVATGTSEGLGLQVCDERAPLFAIPGVRWADVSHYEVKPLTVSEQLGQSLWISMGIGALISFILLVAVLSQVEWDRMLEEPLRTGLVLLGLLIAGPILGLLFSLVPNLFRLRTDLEEVALVRKAGPVLSLYVDPSQRAKSLAVLANHQIVAKAQ